MGFFNKKIDFSRNEVAKYILKLINESDMAIAADVSYRETRIDFIPVESANNYEIYRWWGASSSLRADKVIRYSGFGYSSLDKPEALRDWIYSNMKLKDNHIVMNERIPGEYFFAYYIFPDNNRDRHLKEW